MHLQTEQTQIRQLFSACLWRYDTSDPTLVDLTNNFFVLCTKMKVELYNYSKSVEPCMNILEGKG